MCILGPGRNGQRQSSGNLIELHTYLSAVKLCILEVDFLPRTLQPL